MLVAGLQYLIVELVVASAWTNPSYDWAYDLVPDLGNTACGPYQDRVVCSLLNALMNGGFVAQGILFGLAALVMSRLVARKARGVLVVLVVLALVHAVGLALVAVFHQSPTAAQDATLILSFTGACLAILDGNVTGGGSGIGLATVRALAGEGANVVVAELDSAKVEVVAKELGGPDRAVGVTMDATDENAGAAAVAEAVLAFGNIDLIVNNAGITRAESLGDTTYEDWALQDQIMPRGSFAVASRSSRCCAPRASTATSSTSA